ncbi:hypothetical protein MILUP08_45735 [Micromonospora lupini str. Lupac 08]|uniref:Uncharacterized protein n=1 Tax=Micromonospora lupini str. Lupac 08 TaxID=1150864 RepID=I0LAJ5_9ACTN|nr:hypothetical protein MILUP08_45735 [Micromonospora lupini str. Lupac 08]
MQELDPYVLRIQFALFEESNHVRLPLVRIECLSVRVALIEDPSERCPLDRVRGVDQSPRLVGTDSGPGFSYKSVKRLRALVVFQVESHH